jgi:hypothetical protein
MGLATMKDLLQPIYPREVIFLFLVAKYFSYPSFLTISNIPPPSYKIPAWIPALHIDDSST